MPSPNSVWILFLAFKTIKSNMKTAQKKANNLINENNIFLKGRSLKYLLKQDD